MTIYVRDAFETVDQDTGNDVTSIRRSDSVDWQVIYEDTFKRITP